MVLRWYERLRQEPGARQEGRAAATGLLTGGVAESSGLAIRPGSLPCPACEHTRTFADVIDVVAERTTLHCDACGHRWAIGSDGSDGSDGSGLSSPET